MVGLQSDTSILAVLIKCVLKDWCVFLFCNRQKVISATVRCRHSCLYSLRGSSRPLIITVCNPCKTISVPHAYLIVSHYDYTHTEI